MDLITHGSTFIPAAGFFYLIKSASTNVEAANNQWTILDSDSSRDCSLNIKGTSITNSFGTLLGDTSTADTVTTANIPIIIDNTHYIRLVGGNNYSTGYASYLCLQEIEN